MANLKPQLNVLLLSNRSLCIMCSIPEIVHWFFLLAHSEQAYLRLFSIEIMALLLQQDAVDTLVLVVLISQCSDPSATVRARSLTVLCDCVESSNTRLASMFDSIFCPASQSKRQEADQIDVLDLLQSDEGVQDAASLLPNCAAMLKLLEERATDEKVHVRKNALQLLLVIMRRDGRFLLKELLKLLGNSCRDVALMVRRHMAQMITDLLLQYADNCSVQLVWVRSVLPLVLDAETRVLEKALECTDQLIFSCLASGDNQLCWSLLEVITDQGFSTYLSKGIYHLIVWIKYNVGLCRNDLTDFPIVVCKSR